MQSADHDMDGKPGNRKPARPSLAPQQTDATRNRSEAEQQHIDRINTRRHSSDQCNRLQPNPHEARDDE
jgi:hypothetical protein